MAGGARLDLPQRQAHNVVSNSREIFTKCRGVMIIQVDLGPIILAVSFMVGVVLGELIVKVHSSKTLKVIDLFGFQIIWIGRDDPNFWSVSQAYNTRGKRNWFFACPKWFNKLCGVKK